MPFPLNVNAPMCDVCGRFLRFEDIRSGAAVHRMVTPDSDVSMEEFETLCPTHTTPSQGDASK